MKTHIGSTLLGFVAIAIMVAGTPPAAAASAGSALPYGIASRTAAPAYLNMPQLADGKIPLLLSQTGAFRDTRNLVPAAGLIPYDLVVPFWSDGAVQAAMGRHSAGQDKILAHRRLDLPERQVFVKTFELPIDAANPGSNAGSKRACWYVTARAASTEWSTNGGLMTAMRICSRSSLHASERGGSPIRPGTTPAGRTAWPAITRKPAACSASRHGS